MPLIVTPGAPDADSFVSLEAADRYHLNRGNEAWAAAEEFAREAALRRASAYLSSSFSWRGVRTHRRGQSLAWPRAGVTDSEGDALPSDTIPAEIVSATCEIAAVELANPGAMSPSIDLTQRVKRERVDVLETEYFAASAGDVRPVLPMVADLIGGLLSTRSNTLVGYVTRA